MMFPLYQKAYLVKYPGRASMALGLIQVKKQDELLTRTTNLFRTVAPQLHIPDGLRSIKKATFHYVSVSLSTWIALSATTSKPALILQAISAVHVIGDG